MTEMDLIQAMAKIVSESASPMSSNDVDDVYGKKYGEKLGQGKAYRALRRAATAGLVRQDGKRRWVSASLPEDPSAGSDPALLSNDGVRKPFVSVQDAIPLLRQALKVNEVNSGIPQVSACVKAALAFLGG